MRPMPRTLQRYIFIEMGKVFLLTVIGLTGVFLLGGGVLNMVKIGEVTPGQLLRLLIVLLPLALPLSLPVSALLSAASVYGRLSADNELVACRSSGINIQVLLLPGLLMSLVSAALTFVLFNFIVPGMLHNLNDLVGKDVGEMIEQRLRQPKGLALGRWRLRADQWNDANFADNVFDLGGIVYMETDDNGDWSKFGTVRRAVLQYDYQADSVVLQGRLEGLSFYDLKSGRIGRVGVHEIARNELPFSLPMKVKFLNLLDMLEVYRDPDAWWEVQAKLDDLRFELASVALYDAAMADWREADHTVRLEDDRGVYELHARQAGRAPREKSLEFRDVNMTFINKLDNVTKHFEAGSGMLTVYPEKDQPRVNMSLSDVALLSGERRIQRKNEEFAPIAVPAEIVDRIAAYDAKTLLAGGDSLPTSPKIKERRAAARQIREKTLHDVILDLNERTAFSASVCVLVVLAAALGIAMRGSQMLVSFGISVVPLLLVMVLLLSGKQLARNPETFVPGLIIMWSGIVAVFVVDLIMVARVIRR